MLYRWIDKLGCGEDIQAASWRAFMNIGFGKTATSPLHSASLAMFRDNDRYEMNRDRMYHAAIRALDANESRQPFERPPLVMPGQPVFEEMLKWLDQSRRDGLLMPHDVVVGTEIARIVSGGEIAAGTIRSEQDLLDAERRSFLKLVNTDSTRARIGSMLDCGKPLRN